MVDNQIPTEEQLVEFKNLLNSKYPLAISAFNTYKQTNNEEQFNANIILALNKSSTTGSSNEKSSKFI